MVATIETEGLTKRYGSARGIEAVDLRVEGGEVFGFLGPNGAGKTTAIRVLLDLHRASSGTARILGLDCHRDSLAVRRRVGYLPGDLALHERMTGTALLAWLADLRGGVDPGRTAELVERLGAEVDRPVAQLSKGNRQKLGLVQAFMHDPEVLVLDEPTTGLDPLVQQAFHEVVREVVDGGATVFLSSHSLDEVQHIADRVGIIREGRLVATELVSELRDRSIRSVEVHFATPVEAAPFAGIAGVSDLVVEGTRLRCTVAGQLDPLVKALATHPVVDLLSRAADLEEIFLTYYRGDGSTEARRPSSPGGEVHDGA